MEPPIIVYEPGDVMIFQSVEDAERYLESPDVLENRYVAYDSEGTFLKLEAPQSRAIAFLGTSVVPVEKVTISSGEPQPSHLEDLKQILRESLEHFSVPREWLQRATLNDLLTKSIELAGFTR